VLTVQDLTLRYTIDGSNVNTTSTILNEELVFNETTTIKIQAYNKNTEPVGQPYHQKFYLKPITASVDNIWKDLPPGSWEKLRFENELNVTLISSFDNYSLRYTLDNSSPNAESPVYNEPLTLKETTQVRAQLFNENGEIFGSGFSEWYYVILNEPSLTTGKPSTASNEKISPESATLATNGRISLWEMWGGHVGEHVWIKVDLEQVENVSKFKVYNFWDNWRYYQYTIDGSLDGENWTELVDFSKNEVKASIDGYEHNIDSTQARYLRINLIYNSANPGLHLVEFNAFH